MLFSTCTTPDWPTRQVVDAANELFERPPFERWTDPLRWDQSVREGMQNVLDKALADEYAALLQQLSVCRFDIPRGTAGQTRRTSADMPTTISSELACRLPGCVLPVLRLSWFSSAGAHHATRCPFELRSRANGDTSTMLQSKPAYRQQLQQLVSECPSRNAPLHDYIRDALLHCSLRFDVDQFNVRIPASAASETSPSRSAAIRIFGSRLACARKVGFRQGAYFATSHEEIVFMYPCALALTTQDNVRMLASIDEDAFSYRDPSSKGWKSRPNLQTRQHVELDDFLARLAPTTMVHVSRWYRLPHLIAHSPNMLLLTGPPDGLSARHMAIDWPTRWPVRLTCHHRCDHRLAHPMACPLDMSPSM